MAKSRYVKVIVQSDVKSLSGYKVVGDLVENGNRVLMLERPESLAKKREAVVAEEAKSFTDVYPLTESR